MYVRNPRSRCTHSHKGELECQGFALTLSGAVIASIRRQAPAFGEENDASDDTVVQCNWPFSYYPINNLATVWAFSEERPCWKSTTPTKSWSVWIVANCSGRRGANAKDCGRSTVQTLFSRQDVTVPPADYPILTLHSWAWMVRRTSSPPSSLVVVAILPHEAMVDWANDSVPVIGKLFVIHKAEPLLDIKQEQSPEFGKGANLLFMTRLGEFGSLFQHFPNIHLAFPHGGKQSTAAVRVERKGKVVPVKRAFVFRVALTTPNRWM